MCWDCMCPYMLSSACFISPPCAVSYIDVVSSPGMIIVSTSCSVCVLVSFVMSGIKDLTVFTTIQNHWKCRGNLIKNMSTWVCRWLELWEAHLSCIFALVIPAGVFHPFCSPLLSTRCRNVSSDTAVIGLLLLTVLSLICSDHWHYCQMQKPHRILCHLVTSSLHPTCATWKLYVPVLIVQCHFQFLCFFLLKQSTFVAMETMTLLIVTCNMESEIVCFRVLSFVVFCFRLRTFFADCRNFNSNLYHMITFDRFSPKLIWTVMRPY